MSLLVEAHSRRSACTCQLCLGQLCRQYSLALAACRRDNALAHSKAWRLVRRRPCAPDKPPERLRARPGVEGVSARVVPAHHRVHLAPSRRPAVGPLLPGSRGADASRGRPDPPDPRRQRRPARPAARLGASPRGRGAGPAPVPRAMVVSGRAHRPARGGVCRPSGPSAGHPLAVARAAAPQTMATWEAGVDARGRWTAPGPALPWPRWWGRCRTHGPRRQPGVCPRAGGGGVQGGEGLGVLGEGAPRVDRRAPWAGACEPPLGTERPALGGLGVDGGAVQMEVSPGQPPNGVGVHEEGHTEVVQVGPKGWTTGGHGVMSRRAAARQAVARHRRGGRSGPLAGTAGACGGAIQPQTVPHGRRAGLATAWTRGGGESTPGPLGAHVDDAACHMVRRQTGAQRDGGMVGGFVSGGCAFSAPGPSGRGVSACGQRVLSDRLLGHGYPCNL